MMLHGLSLNLSSECASVPKFLAFIHPLALVQSLTAVLESDNTHFLLQETIKDRGHTSSPVMPSRMVFESVEGGYTPTYTAISRLITYLIAFLRLVTCKITVFHLLSFNAHLVQHDLWSNIRKCLHVIYIIVTHNNSRVGN